MIGVRNACALARNFGDAGIDVVLTDVLTPASANLYRQLLPDCFIVRFVVAFHEAERRAASRTMFLTRDEFANLHRTDRSMPPRADRELMADYLSPEELVRVVDELWKSASE